VDAKAERQLARGLNPRVLDINRRPLRTGIADPQTFFSGDRRAFQRVGAAGARFARIIVPWALIAPLEEPASWDPADPEDPNYSWELPDTTVENAAAAGVEPVLVLMDTPTWASEFANCDLTTCRPQKAAYRAFARAVARRYSGHFEGLPRVRYWQALNEPNLELFFRPQKEHGRFVSPEVYRNLLNAFADAVKGVDPSNRVIAGGLSVFHRGDIAPLRFMRSMLCMRGLSDPRPKPSCEARSRFDIWSMHPYTSGGPTHSAFRPDDVAIGDLPEMSRLLAAAQRAGHIDSGSRLAQFWVTEFAWSTNPPDTSAIPWPRHARWVAEGLYRMWRSGVSTVTWFALRDGTNYGTGLYLRGATLDEDLPKLSLRAFRFPFVALKRPGAIYVWGRTPDSDEGIAAIQVRTGGKWTTIERLSAHDSGIFRGLIPTSRLRGAVRARAAGMTSLPFPLRRTRDIREAPFG
jgi:hypothetical protein